MANCGSMKIAGQLYDTSSPWYANFANLNYNWLVVVCKKREIVENSE